MSFPSPFTLFHHTALVSHITKCEKHIGKCSLCNRFRIVTVSAKNGNKAGFIDAPGTLAEKAIATANTLGLNTHQGAIYCSDTFYTDIDQVALAKEQNLLGVEMESTCIYLNAKNAGKEALCIATVSDSLVTHETLSAEERQTGFSKMITLALEMI